MSLSIANGILWGMHNGGVHTIYCVNLREEEQTLSGGRFSAYTSRQREYEVLVRRSLRTFTDAIDWIEEFEAGTWSFRQDDEGAWFSFDDYVTAIQFKLTHVN